MLCNSTIAGSRMFQSQIELLVWYVTPSLKGYVKNIYPYICQKGKAFTWERHSFSVFSQVLDFSRVRSFEFLNFNSYWRICLPWSSESFLDLCIWFLAQPVAVNSKVNCMQWQKKSFCFNTAAWFHCSWGGELWIIVNAHFQAWEAPINTICHYHYYWRHSRGLIWPL